MLFDVVKGTIQVRSYLAAYISQVPTQVEAEGTTHSRILILTRGGLCLLLQRQMWLCVKVTFCQL